MIHEYINKIINGNSIDIMKEFPDKSVDLTLTDFPYGVSVKYDEYIDTNQNLKDLINLAMPEILRVSKISLISISERNIFDYPRPDSILHWINPAGTGRSNWGFVCNHSVLAYGKDPYSGRKPDTTIQNGSVYKDVLKYKEFHPCPKPEVVWEWFLRRGSKSKTDIILDPFCGSGTTCTIAKKLGRRYIGIDLSKKYCEISQKRVDEQRVEHKKSLFED